MGSFLELNLRSTPGLESGAPVTAHIHDTRDFRLSLQLLAERAQYITGASGIAIALREPGTTHMVCEASWGRTAPEVGARLHIESGISAESVRMRKVLRCDHASSDARVNQETCRALGIESVLVMPLMVGDYVVGIVELFSERPAAFQERDVKTLEHVGEMIQKLILQHMQATMKVGNLLVSMAQEAHGLSADCPPAPALTESEPDRGANPSLPACLPTLAAEPEQPQPRRWGSWLRQSRR
jgi:transcriptional regulator with GAF, ATPase, and Fis domain